MTRPRRPRGAGSPRAALAAVVILFAIVVSGCGRLPTLANTFESDEAVARAVLDALSANDVDRLMALSLTEDEFETIVWPTLPISRPEVGMPMDYVWQDTFTKSRAYLARTVAEHGAQRFSLVRIEFGGATTNHNGYTISRQARLVVKDRDGRQRILRLFGSVIRQEARSKIYSYIVD